MYTAEYLDNFTRQVFTKMGYSEKDAETASKVYIAAELRGISSHGMLRIRDLFHLWKNGRLNTKPRVRIVHETPSTAVVDGDNAIGAIPSTFSMKVAIDKARKAGTGWVATRNSNHFGIAGHYAMMAVEHDMIGIASTHANPTVAPTFSKKRMLGTNPIAVAVPAKTQPLFVADFATTPMARGKLAVAAKKGEKVKIGIVQDADGNPTDDPNILTQGGAILPLGGDREHGSHKGYCLSAIVDILSGVLSGANFGPFVPPAVSFLPLLDEKVGEGTGHFFGAMRIDAFRDPEEFKLSMDKWIDTFRKSDTVPDQPRVLIPGDPERELEEKLGQEGITLVPTIAGELKEVADFFGIDFEVQ